MAQEQPQVKATLGLTGVTMNAMALIAPGAFLWITYQLQAAATAPDGSSVASDMWPGIVLALILCFLTAFSYGELARIYPEAGFGSCYYFAEKAFLDRENAAHHKWARLAKLVTGWAAHLFYWVYPGRDGRDDGDAARLHVHGDQRRHLADDDAVRDLRRRFRRSSATSRSAA